jgi:signal peptidase I
MSPKKNKSKTREYVEALLMALLVAGLLRSFVVEAFKVPSGSMLSTIQIGDFLFVNKFVYGLRIPFTKQWMTHFKEVERGEVVVFIFPQDETKNYIKRVVGIPGDKIVVEGKTLTVNGVEVPKRAMTVQKNNGMLLIRPTENPTDDTTYLIKAFQDWKSFDIFLEEMEGQPFLSQYYRYESETRREFVVQDGHFFVIGDNRNRSFDSRSWGQVPMENLKGRALFVWLSLDYDTPLATVWNIRIPSIRWRRFGHWIE